MVLREQLSYFHCMFSCILRLERITDVTKTWSLLLKKDKVVANISHRPVMSVKFLQIISADDWKWGDLPASIMTSSVTLTFGLKKTKHQRAWPWDSLGRNLPTLLAPNAWKPLFTSFIWLAASNLHRRKEKSSLTWHLFWTKIRSEKQGKPFHKANYIIHKTLVLWSP